MSRSKNELSKALGLENFPEEEREEILAKVNKRLEEVLIGVLVANISDDDAQKIQKALHEEGADLEEVSRKFPQAFQISPSKSNARLRRRFRD